MESLIENAVNAISLGSFYALVALGIALIFGIMRLVNIAHGELIMAGAYVLVLVDSSVPVVIVCCLSPARSLRWPRSASFSGRCAKRAQPRSSWGRLP